MKKYCLTIMVATIVFFTACSKSDNSGIHLQAHDQNRMMDSIHAMMNRMMAMPPTTDPEIDFVNHDYHCRLITVLNDYDTDCKHRATAYLDDNDQT
jgi:major membrane immunogen (membrane-anchored lipoprotein)